MIILCRHFIFGHFHLVSNQSYQQLSVLCQKTQKQHLSCLAMGPGPLPGGVTDPTPLRVVLKRRCINDGVKYHEFFECWLTMIYPADAGTYQNQNWRPPAWWCQFTGSPWNSDVKTESSDPVPAILWPWISLARLPCKVIPTQGTFRHLSLYRNLCLSKKGWKICTRWVSRLKAMTFLNSHRHPPKIPKAAIKGSPKQVETHIPTLKQLESRISFLCRGPMFFRTVWQYPEVFASWHSSRVSGSKIPKPWHRSDQPKPSHSLGPECWGWLIRA